MLNLEVSQAAHQQTKLQQSKLRHLVQIQSQFQKVPQMNLILNQVRQVAIGIRIWMMMKHHLLMLNK